MAVSAEVEVGTAHVECPVCQEPMPIVVTGRVENDELAHEGGATFVCTSNMADVWAHMWQHEDDDD